MSLPDNLLSLLVPHECLGCGAEGDVLCAVCCRQLEITPDHCYRCRQPTKDYLTCQACRRTSALQRVRAAVTYKANAKELVWKLKFAGAQAAAKQMAFQMVRGQSIPLDSVIVPVPTATSRVRQRGYDQAVLLAHAVARLSGGHYANCLARLNQAHQVGANRQHRLEQLTQAFRVNKHMAVRSAHIILIDDVVTTGATLEAAATSLRAAGARQIEALVFAQP